MELNLRELSKLKMPEIQRRLREGQSLRQIMRDLRCSDRLVQKAIRAVSETSSEPRRCPECGRMMKFNGEICRECKVIAEKEAQRKAKPHATFHG